MKIEKVLKMELKVIKEECGDYAIVIDGEYVDFFRKGRKDVMIDRDVAFFLKKILEVGTYEELENRLIEMSGENK